MKEQLLELIDKTDTIEKLFHRTSVAPGIAMVASETIYDVQEFRIWIQELKCELQEIHDRTHNKFIWEVINDLSANFNGWSDRERFNKVKGDLIAIRRNIDAYYPPIQSKPRTNEKEKNMPKKSKIFISHSSKDKLYVEEIVSLLDDIGLSDEQIFCSSIPGYDIPLGKTIFEYLREQFLEFNLHILFIHSPNYYESPISLNEMGAAWALRNNFTSVLLPGFEFDDMKGVVNNANISIKLDNTDDEVKDKLNQLRNLLISEFELKRKADILWEKKRDQFIKRIKELQNLIQVTEDAVEMVISQEADEILHNAAKDANAHIIVTHNLSSGKCIQAGEKSYSEAMGVREFSKWDAAFDELLAHGYIKELGKKHEVFQVTDKGFSYIENKA